MPSDSFDFISQNKLLLARTVDNWQTAVFVIWQASDSLIYGHTCREMRLLSTCTKMSEIWKLAKMATEKPKTCQPKQNFYYAVTSQLPLVLSIGKLWKSLYQTNCGNESIDIIDFQDRPTSSCLADCTPWLLKTQGPKNHTLLGSIFPFRPNNEVSPRLWYCNREKEGNIRKLLPMPLQRYVKFFITNISVCSHQRNCCC